MMRIPFALFEIALKRNLTYEIALTRQGKMIYLFANVPIRLEYFKEVFVKSLSDTLSDTLTDTLTETLTDTLTDTLTGVDFLNFCLKKTVTILGERGAGQRVYQYLFDGHRFQEIVRQAWLHTETCRVWRLICDDEQPVSARGVTAKLKILGTTMTVKRANLILNVLTEHGLLENNGAIRTRGRDVVRQKNIDKN